jgi:outer membrane cobalamin receptor
MRRALAAVLLGLLGVLPVSAQQPAPTDAQTPTPSPPDQPAEPQPMVQTPGPKPDDPTRLEPVVVTVTRTEQPAGQAPASVTVLTREDISLSPSVTLDDLLRQVPGFSLFRRSSSLVTHPTTQGLSLRGIGPSGTSRALVLVDGVPANDAFGGWVYWDRIPLQGIEQIEVVRGGGSSAWGNYAIGGVVHVLTRRPIERGVFFDGSYGTHNTMNFDLLVHEVQGPFRVALEGNYFKTDGYFVVKDSRRGAIDIEADSRHVTFNGRAEMVLSPEASLFISGTYFDEDRGNGTPLQNNGTTYGGGAFGGRLGTTTSGAGEFRLALYADNQQFGSTFSTQALNRNSETLALDQKVPTTSTGGWLQWSRQLGNNLFSAGGDARWVTGETIEDVFNNNVFLRTRVAGGKQLLTGVFVQDVYTPLPVLELVGGVRVDYWSNYNGNRTDTPPPAGVPARQTFGDSERFLTSPRGAALFHATSTTDLRASIYQGYRVPTLNELYRLFRVRNDVTVANPGLHPERMTGGELGLEQRWGPFAGRVTGFWNDVKDLVANVTLTSRLPDCPVGTTCRQRQNLDLARIRGVETELELRIARDWRFLLGYLFTDAHVIDAPQQPGLEGKRLAQVPMNTVTGSFRFTNPDWFNLNITGRWVGDQFEDDLNTLPLGSYFVMDLFLSRSFGKWFEAYLAIDNLLDKTYTTGRTSEGVISIGEPRIIRGGVRVHF